MTGTPQPTNPIEVFFSYAHEDEKMREQLEKHVSTLRRQGVISSWHDREIRAGQEWASIIDRHINSAGIILMLVSAYFLDSDYCYEVEMKRAMERHEAGEARVIPIILRPCDWEDAPFGKLQALPKNARPVTQWGNRDEALLSIVEGLRAVAERPFADLDAPSSASFEQTSSSGPQVPLPVVDFVGRAEEIDRLVNALSQAGKASTGPAVCVRGMGGVGKSQLALKVAERVKSEFPDGQILLEMHGAGLTSLSPNQALQNVIRTFDRNSKLPDDLSDLQTKYQSVLSGNRIMILADDAEDAEQLRPLLPPAGCGLLITSRQRFTLPGMVAVNLDALPTDAAKQFLLEICPRLGEAAPRLATLCGYLPLALRVSASVLANDDAMRVERYLERLSNERDRLKLLHDPDDAKLDVDASLRVSYDALTAVAQDALCQLSVFPGSFDLKAALAVVTPSDEADVEQLLSLLRRRSLLQWDEEEQRYSLHDLLRVFASTRLLGADAVRRRHALYFGHLVSAAKEKERSYAANDETNARSADSIDNDLVVDLWDLYSLESANIDASLQWAREHEEDSESEALLLDYLNASDDLYDTPLDQDTIDSLLAILRRKGDRSAEMSLLSKAADFFLITNSDESFKYQERAVQIARELKDPSSEGNLLIGLGMSYWMLKETPREIECYESALALGQKNEDRCLEGNALTNLGNVYAGINERGSFTLQQTSTVSVGGAAELRDAEQALQYYELALRIWRETKISKAEAVTLDHLGHTHEVMGEATKALEYYEQALSVQADESRKCPTLGSLGALRSAQGNYTEAQRCFEQMLEITRRLGKRGLEGDALLGLGDVAINLGDAKAALSYNKQALPIARELGNRAAEGVILGTLSKLSGELDENSQALAYLEQALVIARELADQDWIARLLSGLGDKYLSLNRKDEALAAYQEAISLDPSPSRLNNLGALLYDQDNYAKARDCFEQMLEVTRQRGDRGLEGDALLSLGDIASKLGDPHQALAYNKQALPIAQELGVKSAEARILATLADLSAELDETSQAVEYYERVLTIARELADKEWMARLLSLLGSDYLSLNREDEALAAYQEAISLDSSPPATYSAYSGLGILYLGSRRYDDAIDAYQRVVELSTDAATQAQITEVQGDLLQVQGRAEEAFAAYVRASKIDQDCGHAGLGKCYYLLGRYDEALAEYQQAHKIDPEDSEAVLGLALVHRRLDNQIEFETNVTLARGLIDEENTYDQAALAAVRGDVDESLNLIESGLSRGEITSDWIRANLSFDFIRDDPRFVALLEE